MKVIFVCRGNSVIGLGHVSRCLALAYELAARQQEVFFLAAGDSAQRMARDAGFDVSDLPADDLMIADDVRPLDPDLIIIDHNDFGVELCGALRQIGPVVNLAAQGLCKWYADMTINSTAVLDMPEPPDSLPGRQWYRSPSCAFLRPSFTAKVAAKPYPIRSTSQRVLVAVGAGDEIGLLAGVLPAMNEFPSVDEITVVVGPAFVSHDWLGQLAAASKHRCRILTNVSDMAGLMRRHDWAVSAMGMTTLEMLFTGLPTVAVCSTSFHVLLGQELQSAGGLVHVDATTEGWEHRLVRDWQPLSENPAALERLRSQGQAVIDGRGAARAARIVIDLGTGVPNSGATTRRRNHRVPRRGGPPSLLLPPLPRGGKGRGGRAWGHAR